MGITEDLATVLDFSSGEMKDQARRFIVLQVIETISAMHPHVVANALQTLNIAPLVFRAALLAMKDAIMDERNR